MMEWKEIDELTEEQMWGMRKDEVIHDMLLRLNCGHRFVGRITDSADVWHNDVMVDEGLDISDITHFAVLTNPTPKDK